MQLHATNTVGMTVTDTVGMAVGVAVTAMVGMAVGMAITDMVGMAATENKDFRLIGHLCASRFPSMVYCSFMPGQIANLTGQKAILFGICPMAACYFQLCTQKFIIHFRQNI